MGLLQSGELGAGFGDGEGWFGHGCLVEGREGWNPNPDAGMVVGGTRELRVEKVP